MDFLAEILSHVKYSPLSFTWKETLALLAMMPLFGAVGYGIGRVVENNFAEFKPLPVPHREVPPAIRYATIAGCFMLGMVAHTLVMYLI